MDAVTRLISDGAARLAGHPLFGWLRDAPVPAAARLSILPALAPFAMGYRDVCAWVLPYPDPHDDFQRAINAHAAEDATHSRLFLHDWDQLGLDQQLGWTAGDVLWWLFLAPETAAMRKAGMTLLSGPAADGGDPLLRFAWAEVIEACGAVFFGEITKVAAQAGGNYRYLGAYHLARESGHIDPADLFAGQRLSAARRQQAEALASAMLGTFAALFDCLLDFGIAYPGRGVLPVRRSPRTPSPPAASSAPAGQPGRLVNPAVAAQLDAQREQVARHPLYRWLRSETSLPADSRLALLMPHWAMDIMGYRDLCEQVLTCPPDSARGRDVNTWAAALAGHSAVFLDSWDALGMDERLGWTASQTLRWLYLDPRMDVHRRNMTVFARLAAGEDSPLLRLWLMDALEASGEAWFAATGDLAGQAEQHLGIRLDYLAGRCEGPPPGGGEFRNEPLSPAESDRATALITTVFGAVAGQLDLTLSIAHRGGTTEQACVSS